MYTCILLCILHSSLCIQIYLNLSQPNYLIKSDIETIAEQLSLYNIGYTYVGYTSHDVEYAQVYT